MDRSPQYFIHGNGKPLVFQHGLGANRAQIISLLSGLENVSLLTTDSPGHGLNPPDPAKTPSFNWFTDVVIRAMDDAGWDKVIAGGLSMGSGIALNMALRYPERVAALILLRPAWLCAPFPENLQILLEVADYLESENGKQDFMQLKAFREISKDLPAAAESVLGMFDRDFQDYTPELLRAMTGSQPCPENSTFPEVPVLIIGNDRDPLHPLELAEKWHEKLPGSRLVEVTSRYADGTRHKQEVIRAIQDFINNISII